MRLGGRLSELSIIIVAIVRVGVNIVHATILDKELWINILNVAKQKMPRRHCVNAASFQ
jgi:hypothetical protein